MYKNILTKSQLDILPLIGQFNKEYIMVGGTAIALQIGHRRSIDFDLFTESPIKRKHIYNIIKSSNYDVEKLLYEAFDQMHLIVNGVKLTFFNYPFKIIPSVDLNGVIQMPDLLTLAAMKAHALGGRGKWKDYVDLYFLLKDHLSIKQIMEKAKEIYLEAFNDKLFAEQLVYFDDMDYSEKVEFISENVPEETIQVYLKKVATELF